MNKVNSIDALGPCQLHLRLPGHLSVVSFSKASRAKASICRTGIVVWLVKNEHKPEVQEWLRRNAFSCKSHLQTSLKNDSNEYIGYCSQCQKNIELQLKTAISLDDDIKHQLIFKQSQKLFDRDLRSAEKSDISHAIEAVFLVCKAVLVGEFRGRERRELLTNARLRKNEVSDTLFLQVCDILVGYTTAMYVIALLDNYVAWEIDLLVAEIRRNLRKGDEVDLISTGWLRRYLGVVA